MALTPSLISQAEAVNDCGRQQKLPFIQLHIFGGIILGYGLNGGIYILSGQDRGQQRSH